MFDLECCVTFITNQASKTLADSFSERLRPFGVTRTQWVALYRLGQMGPVSQSVLAAEMNVQASSLTRLLDRMEREDLVARRRDDSDRRVVFVRLTKTGADKLETVLSIGEDTSQQFSEGISEEDIETFTRVLDKIVINSQKTP